jgi:hypothetical protein
MENRDRKSEINRFKGGGKSKEFSLYRTVLKRISLRNKLFNLKVEKTKKDHGTRPIVIPELSTQVVELSTINWDVLNLFGIEVLMQLE